jgi:hypothetical protein
MFLSGVVIDVSIPRSGRAPLAQVQNVHFALDRVRQGDGRIALPANIAQHQPTTP